MASLTPRLDALDYNLVINGSMDYWQRNTTFTANGQAYGADRWKHNIISGHYQVLRATNVPSVENIQYSWRADCLVTASPAAADQEMVEHYIEQSFARKLNGRKASLIFWVSSPKTGQHNIYVSTNPSGTNYNMLIPYTVTAANTWQKIVLTVDMSSCPAQIAAGTSAGFMIGFPLAIGSNRTSSSSNTWVQSDIKLLTGSPNLLDNTANDFYVTGVMLLPYAATSTNALNPDSYIYAGRDVAGDLRLCQRYYEKSHNIETPPGAPGGGGQQPGQSVFISRNVGNEWNGCHHFLAIKRATPSVIIYATNNGTANAAYNESAGTNPAASAEAVGTAGFSMFLQSAQTVNQLIRYMWTAEAEI